MPKNYLKFSKIKRYLLFSVFICVILAFSPFSTTAEAAQTFKLKVKSASMNTVTISWNQQVEAKGYKVYRSYSKSSGYELIQTLPSNTTTYKDSNLDTSKTYYYKVISTGEHKYKTNPVKKTKVIGFDTTGSVYGSKLTQKQRTEVGNRVAYFINTKITSDMSDAQKVLTAHDYIVNHCDRADDWSKNGANTAWGALIYGEAQCSGYSRAMKALCDAMGIGCYHVYANQNALNPSHQWNLVQVDGNWYHIDLDCNDNSQAYVCFLLSDEDEMNTVLMDWNTKDYPKAKFTYDPQIYLNSGIKAANNAANAMKQTAIELGMITDATENTMRICRYYYNFHSININKFGTHIYDDIIKAMNENLKAYSNYFDGYPLYCNITIDINKSIYCHFLFDIGFVVDYDNITDDEIKNLRKLIDEFDQTTVDVPYDRDVLWYY